MTTHRHHHHTDCQTFSFLAYRWCVTHALELIDTDPTAAQLDGSVDIAGLARFLTLPSTPAGSLNLVQVMVDSAYAATTDLTTPILLAPVETSAGEELGYIAIDGWHRIYRALTEETTRLPAYILSRSTALTVRMDLAARGDR